MTRFDDEVGTTEAEDIEARGRLFCPVHLVALVCYASSKKRGKSYHKCPVADCTHTDSKPRSKCRFASSPTLCPCCSKPDKPVACIVKGYKRYNVVMGCPQCDFDVEISRPDIEYQRQRYWRDETADDQ